MKNKHKFKIEEIIENPQLLLNKFFHYKSKIDNIKFSSIYYFYKIDNKFFYFNKIEHYSDEPNNIHFFCKKADLKWMKNWPYYNFNKLF